MVRTRAAATLALGAIVLSCSGSRPPERPNVLLVTIDTLRADHCSAYGYSRPTTPRLDRLARDGVRFATAYAPMPTTGPSHASMFTGLLPLWHGVLKNGQPLPPDRFTLAEALQGAGYSTAAVVGSFAVDHRFGLDQGFASYDDRFSGERASIREWFWEGNVVGKPFDRRADETRLRAVEWLRSNGYLQPSQPWTSAQRPPFFLWVHFFDPHSPYDPPPGSRALFPPQGTTRGDQQIAAYDAEIHFADEQMGLLLDALEEAGRLDQTVVVVVSDHGEGLMQHGYAGHGRFVYEEAVRVPLVLRWPGVLPAGRIVAEPVGVADLAPTLLELLGLPALPSPIQGQGLAAIMRDHVVADPRREILLQRRRYDGPLPDGTRLKGDQYGLRLGRWKYIEAREDGTSELFDLDADPHELRDVRAESTGQVDLMAERLHALAEGAPVLSPNPVSEEDARRLRALGYVP